MIKVADLVLAHQETLATIETWDNGKPYSDSIGDVMELASVFRYYGGVRFLFPIKLLFLMNSLTPSGQ